LPSVAWTCGNDNKPAPTPVTVAIIFLVFNIFMLVFSDGAQPHSESILIQVKTFGFDFLELTDFSI